MTSQELLNPRNARVLLCLALAGSGALLIAWQSHLTFLIDDWDLLLLRRGFNADVLLDPHARHLIVGPALEYKAIQATLGMDSHLPYGAVATASFLASVALLYVYVRRRVGDWVALAAVLPILVMGSAYEDLLSAFQIGYFGSMAFGIGALLVIERADGRGDAFACVLLVAVARVRGDRARLRCRGRGGDRPATRAAETRLGRRRADPALRRLVPDLRAERRAPRAERVLTPQCGDHPAVCAGRVREQRRLAARFRHAAALRRQRRPGVGTADTARAGRDLDRVARSGSSGQPLVGSRSAGHRRLFLVPDRQRTTPSAAPPTPRATSTSVRSFW